MTSIDTRAVRPSDGEHDTISQDGGPLGLPSVTTAILAWQTTGRAEWLEQLLEITWSRIVCRIAAVQRRHGVYDPNSVDDAMSLVLDHLRRLPGAKPGEPAVGRFDAARARRASRPDTDVGLAYLLCLAHARSLDIVRARRTKDGPVLSELDVEATASMTPADDESWLERLRQAAELLEPRQRRVVELLLEGQRQAEIARSLAVSEGTVSRLRRRAVAALRELLDG